MRFALLALVPLLLTVSTAHAAKAPLTGGPTPGGAAIFTTDPFGYLLCDPDELTATDPADKTHALPAARWCSGQILSIHELSTKPPQSVGLGDATELALTPTFIDATNLALYDPTMDVVAGSTRTSVFHVAPKGALAALLVNLTQTVKGTQLVQVYSLKNTGSVPLDLRIDGVVDADIDTGLGSGQNYGIHDLRWPGASLPGSVAATVSDSTQLIGATLALQGGVPGGYRTLRALAPGWEIYRVPALNGYYDPAFLDGLFTFPAAAFGNGANRPFTDEIPDDVNADGISDAPGDLVVGLQTTLTLAVGATQAVTLTTTLVSGGPYLTAPTCPLPDAQLGSAQDFALDAVSVFGAATFSISAGALPEGLSLVNGHVVGKPTKGGPAKFDLTVTDERSRQDTVACSINVVGCATDCQSPPGLCQLAGSCDEASHVCIYPALPDGTPCGGSACLAGVCVGEESGSTGGAGTASTGGSAGTGSGGSGGASSGSGASASGGTASGPSGAGASGSGGAGDGAYAPTGGCSCGVERGSIRSPGWALLGLAVLGLRRRKGTLPFGLRSV